MITSARWLVVVLCAALLVLAGSATTYGHFVDTEQATGSVQAANSFNGNGGGGNNGGGNTGPPGNRAYNDANDNGQFDDNESTYKAKDLASFDDSSVNLVIPSDVKKVKVNGNVQMTANSIDSQADITAKNGNLGLNATGGTIDIRGSTVKSTTGSVQIDAAGGVSLENSVVSADNGNVNVDVDGLLDLDGATVTSNHQITLIGRTVSARNAEIDSKNSNIVLQATNRPSELDAAGAKLTTNGDITLRSSGSVQLDTATIAANNGNARAFLGSDDDSLSVDSALLSDGDDTLVYSPGNASVIGNPSAGSLQAD